MRSRPLRDKALAYLERHIAALPVSQRGRLAPVRQLAHEAGVSVFTLSRLMNEMAVEKKLTIIPGHGTWISGSEIQKPGADALSWAHKGPKWERLVNQISRDIHGGRYLHGANMPPFKRLMIQYGASLPTLKKALAQLIAEQVLVRNRNQYQVRSVVQRHGDSSVMVITLGQENGLPWFVNERDHDFFWVLERECCNTGLFLRTMSYLQYHARSAHAEPFERLLREQMEKHNVIGFILVAAEIENAHDLARFLGNTGKPVAILDESSRFPARIARGLSPLSCIFGMENSVLPGKKIGRYLLELGHRRIGFFTLHPGSNWSELRLAGLREAMSAAGNPGALEVFQTTVNVPAGRERLAATFRKRVDSSTVEGFDLRDDGFNKRLARQLDRFWHTEISRASIEGLVKRAVADKGITAWVAENDETAFLLLDLLAEKGTDVPREVSVIGFDNYMEAQLRGMSSYDFSFERAAHSMMEFVINPHARVYANASRRIEIEGMVVTRNTTASPLTSNLLSR